MAVRNAGQHAARYGLVMTRVLALVVALACCPYAARADWLADADAGLVHDSNLGNAELKRDIRSDTALAASVSAGHFVQLSRTLSLTLTADVKGEAYQHFGGMSNLAFGPTLSLRDKFGVGTTVPWVRLSGAAARLEFEDEVRDGWRYGVSLAAGQRIAARWDLSAEYSYERRTGDQALRVLPTLSGSVFDLSSRSVRADVRYSIDDRTMVFASYAWRHGDVVSTSTPNAKIFRASSALTRDPTFGSNAFAYRLDAVSRIASVGISQALSDRSALNVSFQRQVTHAESDNNYLKSVFAASYSHSFF